MSRRIVYQNFRRFVNCANKIFVSARLGVRQELTPGSGRKRILLRSRSSLRILERTRIFLAGKVRVCIHKLITCILFPRKRRCTFRKRAHALIERECDDFRTRSDRDSQRCAQQNARNFARLQYLHGFLLCKRATRMISKVTRAMSNLRGP